MSFDWLDAGNLADLAGISFRKARAPLQAALASGKSWRGATLIVRKVHGRGGRSGQRYEVRVDSLPVEIQTRWKSLQTPVESRVRHGKEAQAERDWWYSLLTAALATEKHSAERGDVLRRIAATRHIGLDGNFTTVSERTLQRKLDAFERTDSVAVLGRKKRADAGERKVIVTAKWDKAVPFADTVKGEIGHELRQYVRGLMKGGENGEMLKTLSERKLMKLTASAGFNPDNLEALCAIPDNLIQREAQYRRIALFENDRKAYEDKVRPRIPRTRDGRTPMEIIVGDVHPVDIVCRRDDGSTVHARAIGWLDVATNRIWLDLVFCEPGKGIRNAHIIKSFVAMVTAWGAPTHLYLDNGSEYNFAEFVDDALKLVNSFGGHISKYEHERLSQIIRAKPYNAAAKPIEGIFALLEGRYFSAIPGWIGGDRQRKKTANVGRAPVPFPGSFDDLRGEIEAAIHLYHNRQQKGSLKGLSPFGAYRKLIDTGWQMTKVEDAAFRLAFSTQEVRKVKQGCISAGGKDRVWTCDELKAYQGDKITVLLPKYENWARLPLLDSDGKLLGFAEPVQQFGFLDPKGAEEAERSAALNRKALKANSAAVPNVSRHQERKELAMTLPAGPVAPVGSVLSASTTSKIVHANLTLTPDELEEKRQSAKQQKLLTSTSRMSNLRKRLLGVNPDYSAGVGGCSASC